MVNTLEESSSDMDMDSSPRCIEYPVENNTEQADTTKNNIVAIIPNNNADKEPVALVN